MGREKFLESFVGEGDGEVDFLGAGFDLSGLPYPNGIQALSAGIHGHWSWSVSG